MNDDVIKLREMTGAGVMDCAKALKDAKGNFDEAAKLIAERGFEKAEKKQSRTTGAGLLYSYIHNNRVGVLIELRCETDFVARSEPFQKLAHDITMHIAAMGPENVEKLLAQPYIQDESKTVEQIVKQTVAKTGENARIERFARFEL